VNKKRLTGHILGPLHFYRQQVLEIGRALESRGPPVVATPPKFRAEHHHNLHEDNAVEEEEAHDYQDVQQATKGGRCA